MAYIHQNMWLLSPKHPGDTVNVWFWPNSDFQTFRCPDDQQKQTIPTMHTYSFCGVIFNVAFNVPYIIVLAISDACVLGAISHFHPDKLKLQMVGNYNDCQVERSSVHIQGKSIEQTAICKGKHNLRPSSGITKYVADWKLPLESDGNIFSNSRCSAQSLICTGARWKYYMNNHIMDPCYLPASFI